MNAAREQILGAVTRALGAAAAAPGREAAVAERLAGHPRNLVPTRSRVEPAGQRALFADMARATAASVAAVASLDDVPAAVADFLAAHNLPAVLRVSPDGALDGIPWGERPLLEVRRGPPDPADLNGVTGAFAGIAETGTLMLLSGPERPATLNFLPDNHIVILAAADIVGPYEDAWDRLRAIGPLPRTVNLVTGPSRTGDIEQKIQLGAHGPRRLHIVIVGDVAAAGRAG